MQNSSRLQSLREIIYANIDPIIDSDYYLLDFPNHGNIGDTLIWEGELEYLRRFNFSCIYSCSHLFFDKKKIIDNKLILLHGGGNFGDFYRGVQEFRLKIVREYPNNKIVIFPQTIHYNDKHLLKKDVEVLNQHKNLTICVRDVKSFNMLKDICTNKILLVPDMAFCLDLKKYTNLTFNDNNILFLKRMDNELSIQNYFEKLPTIQNIKIHDWPTFERKFEDLLFRVLTKISQISFTIPFIGKYINDKTGFLPQNVRDYQMLEGINFINSYDEIYTTRLHGLILSVLLNKKVYLFDNIYGKNSSFYEAWMTEFENVSLIN